MKRRPIHQNLNTSFVSVAALVRYLRGLQFVGSIRVEFASYEAEIVFTESRTIRAREHDQIAGRISHGEDALQRILLRSKEPHGRIHVYRATEGYAGRGDGSIFVDKAIMSGARKMAASAGGGAALSVSAEEELVLSSEDGENALVLAALSEFLRVIDDVLAVGKLSFQGAFRVACTEIADRFPFMQRSNALVYRKGEIMLNSEVDITDVPGAVFAALEPIYNRLRSEPKYSEIVRMSSERLMELTTSRRPEFVRLGLIHYVEDFLARE